MFLKMPLPLFHFSFVILSIVAFTACQSLKSSDKGESSFIEKNYKKERISYLIKAHNQNNVTEAEAAEAYLLGDSEVDAKNLRCARKLYEISYQAVPTLSSGIKIAYIQAGEGEIGEAKALLNKLMALFPLSAEPYLVLLNLLQLEKNDAEAQIIIEKAYRKFPNEIAVVQIYADNLTKKNQYDQAKVILKTYITNHPEKKIVYFQLAKIFFLDKKFVESESYLKEYLKYEPSNQDVFTLLGILAEYFKRYQEALLYYENAYKIDPTNPNCAINYARTLLSLGRYESSLHILQEATSSHLENTQELSYYKALCYKELGDFQKALEYLDYIDITSPVYSETIRLKIILNINLKRLDEAQALLTSLSLSEKNSETEFVFKADILFAFRHYKEAVSVVSEAIKTYPKSQFLALHKIILKRAIESKHQSNRELKQFIQKYPKNTMALNNIGYLSLEENSFACREGKKYIEKAVALEPRNPTYLDSLGWAYVKLGDFKKAHKYLSLALELAQDDEPVVLFHFGELYLNKAQPDTALSFFKRAEESLNKKQYFIIFVDPELSEIKEKCTKRIEQLSATDYPAKGEEL
ncbi:MAG: tetratricopeptide repeat protein [Silvanigrellaceae bacterium]|nr:tetratricopeptide repeat protein [Silvanigrellaceae bacterium]